MKKNLKGKIFGRLKVLEFEKSKIVGKTKLRKKYFWKCLCNCGKITVVESSNLCSGHTTSCGCFKKEQVLKSITKHKMRNTRFYIIWRDIKNRCNYKNNYQYKNYGARGIKICDRWLKFENFRDDMYKSYLGHVKEYGEKNTSIDRINNDGNYELNNCRWATVKEQGNNKRNNKFIIYNGIRLNVSDWEKKLGFKSGTLYNRIFNYGWNIEESFNTPSLR